MSETADLLASVLAALRGQADHVLLQGEEYPSPAPRSVIVLRDLVETGAVTYGGTSYINLVQISVYTASYAESLAIADQCEAILSNLSELNLTFRAARPAPDQIGRVLDFESHRG